MDGQVHEAWPSVLLVSGEYRLYSADAERREAPRLIWRGTDANELMYEILWPLCVMKRIADEQLPDVAKLPDTEERTLESWRHTLGLVGAIEPAWIPRLREEYRGYWRRWHGNRPFPLDAWHPSPRYRPS